MKIYQILHGIDDPSAGTTQSVGYLSHYLAQLHHDVTVLAVGDPPSEWPHKSTLRVFGGISTQFGLAPLKAIQFVRNIAPRHASILHGHGVWRAANLFPLIVDPKAPSKLVWSPRGMLTQWSLGYKAVRKKLFWSLLQGSAL